MKIMVVDDDPIICNMLKIMLTSKGHEVETYLDPTATPFIRHQEGHCPDEICCVDAMLVDYFMPRMNGLEFLKLLEERGCRALQGNKAIITAYGTVELRRELEQLGVKYFKKPFSLPEINRWLEDCASRVAQTGGAAC